MENICIEYRHDFNTKLNLQGKRVRVETDKAHAAAAHHTFQTHHAVYGHNLAPWMTA